jgi:thiol-disulfide isomerase/thioredoxin
MKKTLLPLLTIALLLSLPGLAGEFPAQWTWDTGDDSQYRTEHATLEGKPMPDIHVTGWMNGEVHPDDMKGKVVLVDFYATWCGPCMACIPHNNELLKKYKDHGLVIVGVCTNKKGQENMAQTVQDRGIEYPTARDSELLSQKAWHVHYYPTYAVIDRKGIVRAVDLQPQYVEYVIEKLLAEPAPKS